VRARYATLALRLSAERHGPVRPTRTASVVPAGQASLVAIPARDGTTMLRVLAPGAERVELMGDVTGWEPRLLERRGGAWELRLTTRAGPHHVVVRLDGGDWLVPANLTRMDDELGGSVGLIVIP